MGITIFSKDELCVYGKDLRLVRFRNNISRLEVCKRMNIKGYCYYDVKLYRMEKRKRVCLPAQELIDLINSIESHPVPAL